MQATFWIPGIVGGIILLTLTRWFYNEPADRGITQYGAPANEPVRRLQNNAIAKLRTDVFLKQVQKTTAFLEPCHHPRPLAAPGTTSS